MFWENGKECRTPPRINSQENADYYGPLLSEDCNTEVKKRIARRLKQFSIKHESELTNLVIEGAETGESLSDHDRRYLEKFSELEVLAFTETGIKNIANLPDLPKLMRLELCYNKIESGLEVLCQYPLLRILKMRYNNISTFEAIKPLAGVRLLN